MEIAIKDSIPTYAGGLGVLAGDTIRSFADLNFPVVGITLLARYFNQRVDENGNQVETYEKWSPADCGLKLLDKRVSVEIGSEEVVIKIWKYLLIGIKGSVPIYFLDSDCEENSPENRKLTFRLYYGDRRHRLSQEIILGIGGVRLLELLNYRIDKYHLNEGHSALVILELLKRYSKQELKKRIIFTTHTPMPAGHDRFELELVHRLLGKYFQKTNYNLDDIIFNDELNMTHLALEHSDYINGVTIKHKQVSEKMFIGYPIDSITNGAHHLSWTSKHFQKVYDEYLGDAWVKQPSSLRYIFSIPKNKIINAHQKTKKDLIDFIKKEHGEDLREDILTIGWARRFTLYKRSYLFFMDIERLKKIAEDSGAIQVIFAGKAAQEDFKGKENLRYVFEIKKVLEDSKIKIVFLENYNINIAKKLVSGVDLWLNTPQIPSEASGTSGMKAAFNGVPSFSSLDGWWVEGHIENVTGWSIGKRDQGDTSDYREADELYDKLERDILPTYYGNKNKWQEIMISAIMINGSMFNSHRMVRQYILDTYI